MLLRFIVAHISEVRDALGAEGATRNLDPRHSRPSADQKLRREIFTDSGGSWQTVGTAWA